MGRRPRRGFGAGHPGLDAVSMNGRRIGLGTDLVEIRRVESVARRNPRFLSRVFSSEEVRYCRSKKNRWQHFAARFAAKEAVWKALGRDGVPLKDISVGRAADGRPHVLLRGRPAPHIQLSLSHSDEYALAVALIVRGKER